MKLSVIALDYDGTIFRGDTLDPSVRQAIVAWHRRAYWCPAGCQAPEPDEASSERLPH